MALVWSGCQPAVLLVVRPVLALPVVQLAVQPVLVQPAVLPVVYPRYSSLTPRVCTSPGPYLFHGSSRNSVFPDTVRKREMGRVANVV